MVNLKFHTNKYLLSQSAIVKNKFSFETIFFLQENLKIFDLNVASKA